MHNESADNRTRLPFHPCCCGKGWHGAAPGPSSETNDITGCCVCTALCLLLWRGSGACRSLAACAAAGYRWLAMLGSRRLRRKQLPRGFHGPACLTGWLAYTTLPTLTFYYDGWKAPPKLDSLKGKRGNEKQKMHGQCETWSFGQIYAEGKTMFC